MKGPNLSAWALAHAGIMRFVIVLSAVAGLYCYLSLGRQEDPDYTVKNMLVSAAWPGASAREITDQVAQPIERAIQSLPEVDYIRTNAQPGQVIINVKLRDTVPPSSVATTWTKVRQKVTDQRSALPDGVQGPQFNDDFGDTYGNVYALTGDGFNLPQLKEYSDTLRDKLLQLPDVARVEYEGAPEERIYIEYSSAKLAGMGVDPRGIVETLQNTNAVTSAGVIDAGSERVRIAVTGAFDSVEAIRNIGIAAGGRIVRLGDAATVTRAMADPPSFLMRFDGRDAVGLLVSLRKGGNSDRLGTQIDARITEYQHQVPLGVLIHTVANQPRVVKAAIGEFTRSLAEAVAIVLAVSFLALGWRSGIVVALCIPIVLALTFGAMFMLDIPLHRVSLGALIIALGLLVDDAIIVVEQIETHLQSGWDRARAVTSAYLITARPMLIGTLITAIGFMPIALAKSSSGEYAKAIFEVVAISLGFSWLVAVFVTPFIANRLLPDGKAKAAATDGENAGEASGEAVYDGPFYRRFRGWVGWALDHRWLVIGVTAAMFILSIGLFAVGVPKQFFPTSDRPELVVDLRLSQNASWSATSASAHRMETALRNDPDIVSITSYVGGGTPRFYLSMDVQTPSLSLAQLVVFTKGGEARTRVHDRIQHLLDTRFSEVRGRISTLELGPAVGQPLKIRVSGEDFATIAPIADRIEALMRSDPRVRGANKDYGERLKTVRAELDQDKARALGVTTLAVEQSLAGAIEGTPITRFRDGDRSIQVVARLQPGERNSLDRLGDAQIPTASGRSVPLADVARLVPAFESAELNRRSGRPTITVQADVVGGQPADLVAHWKRQLDALRKQLPANASITVGGVVEESAISSNSVCAQIPAAFLLIIALLVIQLRGTKKMLLVLLTGPLALIGVAMMLAIFRIPFGFVAMLGALALFGLVIRNAVILVSQIELLEAEGTSSFEAVIEAAVHRFRPIMLTALAAILAMIPLTRSIFWGPMAWAIMGGLLIATQLTLFFLPAVYAAGYRLRRHADQPEAARA
ncbi:efflux RND transporter permease subunit [Sphingomonas sp. GB1N7]|uniref:efflux RND transporter permease subunit n=1 Tax=Parasphingomonas caseinilytica TaxID=3096158 RepID=UPI002FC87F39